MKHSCWRRHCFAVHGYDTYWEAQRRRVLEHCTTRSALPIQTKISRRVVSGIRLRIPKRRRVRAVRLGVFEASTAAQHAQHNPMSRDDKDHSLPCTRLGSESRKSLRDVLLGCKNLKILRTERSVMEDSLLSNAFLSAKLGCGLGLRRPNPREAPDDASKEPSFGAFFAQKYV